MIYKNCRNRAQILASMMFVVSVQPATPLLSAIHGVCVWSQFIICNPLPCYACSPHSTSNTHSLCHLRCVYDPHRASHIPSLCIIFLSRAFFVIHLGMSASHTPFLSSLCVGVTHSASRTPFSVILVYVNPNQPAIPLSLSPLCM